MFRSSSTAPDKALPEALATFSSRSLLSMDLVTLWECFTPFAAQLSPTPCNLIPLKLFVSITSSGKDSDTSLQRGVYLPLPTPWGFQFLPHPTFPNQRGCKEILVSGSQATQLCLHYCLTSWEGLLSHRHLGGKNSSPLQ